MRKLFNDILVMEQVNGVMLISFEGQFIFKEFLSSIAESVDLENPSWWSCIIDSLSGIKEAEMVFTNKRLYIRKTNIGYLMILMGIFAPIAMMRLNCDMLIPALNQAKANKGLKRLFKKKT
ncbi:MAG: hypothetical protein JW786_06800 [Desulfobacterales bacterium]|nr:hypothetical protein [Desulfobacterales bacterium]